MSIRKYIYGLAAAAVALQFAACSNIDENDRIRYVEPSEVKKHVLVEDFTGQSCVNCPRAAQEIAKLQEQYGEENVIAVGIYGGDYGYSPVAQGHKPWSLTTETGNSYYTTWGVRAQPACMVDRAGGAPFYNTAYLAAYVGSLIQNEPPVMITNKVSYDAAKKTANISVTISAIQDYNGKRQIWLVEDNIVDMQYMPDGSINNEYVHNHVFRASVNDKDGDIVSINKEEGSTYSITYPIDDAWKPENLSVVSFVFNSDGVQQVEKTPLIAK